MQSRSSGSSLRTVLHYAIELLGVVGLCYVVAGSPVPAVNEAHYLGKAKQYWNPAWCEGDFFLESADAHEVFYWTFGWLTQFTDLATTAWIGRLVVWGFFAFSWITLVRKLTVHRWASVLSAALLLPLIQYGHLAGEWLIGGIEAKGFAWPLVFLGISKALERRWWCVWPLLGAASSFHILVGGWAVVACLIAWLWRWKEERLSVVELACWLVIGGCFALPGLVPAIQLTAQSTAEEIREANLTYTFRRLSHHLVFYRFANWNPWSTGFNVTRPVNFALLLFVWWTVSRWRPENDRLSRLKAIVNGSLCVAGMGIALDVLLGPFPATRAGILRYYWFRLSDILVPVGVATLAVTALDTPDRRRKILLAVGLACSVWGITRTTYTHGLAARSTALQQQSWRGVLPDVNEREVDAAWKDVCGWVRENAPAKSVFLTPTRQQTFKWFAHRPDVVTWKDVPQDAVGLNAWWERRRKVYLLGKWPWHNADACANVIGQYGVTHVLWPAAEDQPLPENARQVYRNDLFRVFAISN